MLSNIQLLFFLCTNEIYICESASPPPVLRFYEPGLSCYVNGTFYESCPTPEWKQKTVNRGKPWE